jgi:AcrR family transcriptional regulator
MRPRVRAAATSTAERSTGWVEAPGAGAGPGIVVARRRTYLPAERVKAELVDATVRLLAGRRASQITTREIAAEAGHDQSLLFRHFGDKANLIRAAAIRELLLWAAVIDEVDDPVDAFVAGFDHLLGRPALANANPMLFMGAERFDNAGVFPVIDAHVAQLVAAGMNESDARRLTVGAMAMVTAFAGAQPFWAAAAHHTTEEESREAQRELLRKLVTLEFSASRSTPVRGSRADRS